MSFNVENHSFLIKKRKRLAPELLLCAILIKICLQSSVQTIR